MRPLPPLRLSGRVSVPDRRDLPLPLVASRVAGRLGERDPRSPAASACATFRVNRSVAGTVGLARSRGRLVADYAVGLGSAGSALATALLVAAVVVAVRLSSGAGGYGDAAVEAGLAVAVVLGGSYALSRTLWRYRVLAALRASAPPRP